MEIRYGISSDTYLVQEWRAVETGDIQQLQCDHHRTAQSRGVLPKSSVTSGQVRDRDLVVVLTALTITMHAQSAQSDTYRVQDAYYYNISIVYVLYYSYHNYNYDYMMIHTGTLINSRVVYISNQRI